MSPETVYNLGLSKFCQPIEKKYLEYIEAPLSRTEHNCCESNFTPTIVIPFRVNELAITLTVYFSRSKNSQYSIKIYHRQEL